MKASATFILFLFVACHVILGQSDKQKKDPAGLWKFEASYAPEGYNSGTLTVGISGNRYSAVMFFSGNGYKFTGDDVKFEKDSLFFRFFTENQEIRVKLYMESKDKLTGKGEYSEGEVPLTLMRTAAR
jgi:hypothetical protein